MEPIPETTEPIEVVLDLTNIEAYLQGILDQNALQHAEMLDLQYQVITVSQHSRALQNNIMVGLGLFIAFALAYKFIKIFI